MIRRTCGPREVTKPLLLFYHFIVDCGQDLSINNERVYATNTGMKIQPSAVHYYCYFDNFFNFINL